MIYYDKFKQSLKHLELQLQNYQTLNKDQPRLIQEAVTESVIQRFEVCYDCIWKLLKRYLRDELVLPDVPNSPKPIFRLANENNLLNNHIERWLSYAEARIATSHDYNAEKAKDAVILMNTFIPDAINLYERMSGQSWE